MPVAHAVPAREALAGASGKAFRAAVAHRHPHAVLPIVSGDGLPLCPAGSLAGGGSDPVLCAALGTVRAVYGAENAQSQLDAGDHGHQAEYGGDDRYVRRLGLYPPVWRGLSATLRLEAGLYGVYGSVHRAGPCSLRGAVSVAEEAGLRGVCGIVIGIAVTAGRQSRPFLCWQWQEQSCKGLNSYL